MSQLAKIDNWDTDIKNEDGRDVILFFCAKTADMSVGIMLWHNGTGFVVCQVSNFEFKQIKKYNYGKDYWN